ncbi:MAG: hypothetical protein QXG18_00510 [Candidatus Pacearchaeota archaeon]
MVAKNLIKNRIIKLLIYILVAYLIFFAYSNIDFSRKREMIYYNTFFMEKIVPLSTKK